ncbi:hypothetical protein DFAR_3010004 [Desulfarculales bacterium]
MLEDPSQPPLAKLRASFQSFQEYFSQNGLCGGCPVSNLPQEMSNLSPTFAHKLAQGIDFMAGRVARVLEEARQTGQLDGDCNTQSLAYFIIASWQGALVHMKALKNQEPLGTFQEVIFGRLMAG